MRAAVMNYRTWALGNFVIVETPLPGFANGNPANGRLPIVFTTLTTNANNDFFDYQPVVTSYATVGGTVWNDTNASGIYVSGDVGIPNVPINLIQDLNTNGLVDPGEPVALSTLTAGDGTYSFPGVVPGNYVIQETDLASYLSTGDIRPPNDNQIGLLVTSGAVTNGNDFLDVFVGAPYTNRAPVALDDSASTPEDTQVSVPVLMNDSDPDNDPITLLSVVTTNGIAVVSGTNVLYTPSTNFFGTKRDDLQHHGRRIDEQRLHHRGGDTRGRRAAGKQSKCDDAGRHDDEPGADGERCGQHKSGLCDFSRPDQWRARHLEHKHGGRNLFSGDELCGRRQLHIHCV